MILLNILAAEIGYYSASFNKWRQIFLVKVIWREEKRIYSRYMEMRKSHFTLDADIHCALRPDDANQNSSKKSKLIFFLDCAWGSLCVSHSGKIRNLYLKHQSTNQSEANAGKKLFSCN